MPAHRHRLVVAVALDVVDESADAGLRCARRYHAACRRSRDSPKLALIQRYQGMLCHTRGPQEWSRNPSPAVSSKRSSPICATPGDGHVLLGVAPREAVGRARGGCSPSSYSGSPPYGPPTAMTRRSSSAGRCGLAANADFGSAISRGSVEQAYLAVVAHAVLGERLDHLEAQAAGVMRLVAVDAAGA